MIGKLKGIVASVELDSAIIDVNGVGYLIFASRHSMKMLNVGEAISLFIETHVREDQITLFAFYEKAEQDAFKILVNKVNGVGTRMALAILSALTPAQLTQAIEMQDTAMLTQANGVGNKLAVRIINELKGKTNFVSGDNDVKFSSTHKINNPAIEDAISALMNLGYNRNHATMAIRKISAEQTEYKVGDLIKKGLKELANE